jgi:uncharacterized membrane protein
MRDIAELRRNMPRNSTAMRVCDALENLIIAESKRASAVAEIVKAASDQAVDIPKFDKTAYQRDYMRKRRAAAKETA